VQISGRYKLHYAWVIAAVTFLTLLRAARIRARAGILVTPLEREFHWSRATISFAIAVGICRYGMIGPSAAAMMGRFGVRRTMLAALAAMGVGVASRLLRVWQARAQLATDKTCPVLKRLAR